MGMCFIYLTDYKSEQRIAVNAHHILEIRRVNETTENPFSRIWFALADDSYYLEVKEDFAHIMCQIT